MIVNEEELKDAGLSEERIAELEACLDYKCKVVDVGDELLEIQFSKEMPALFASSKEGKPGLGNNFSFSFELPVGCVADPGTEEGRAKRDDDLGAALNTMFTPLIGTIHSLFLRANFPGMKVTSDAIQTIANVVDANENMLMVGIPIDSEFASMEGEVPDEKGLQVIAEQSLNMVAAVAATMFETYGKTLDLSTDNCSGKVVIQKNGPNGSVVLPNKAGIQPEDKPTDFDPNYQ